MYLPCIKSCIYYHSPSFQTSLHTEHFLDTLEHRKQKHFNSFMTEVPVIYLYDRNLRHERVNPLSANITKWSNTLKQFVGKLPTNCLSVFDHFVGLASKGLK